MFSPGQVILYKDGPNIISKFIRLIQGNRLTHCAIVIVEDQRNPYLLEIENYTSTVKITKLRDTLHYSNEIYVATNETLYVPRNINRLSALLKRYDGSKYSGKAIINAAINHFFGLFDKKYQYREFLKVTRKFTCASLVADVLMYISNFKCANISLTEPDDFTLVPWKLRRIK